MKTKKEIRTLWKQHHDAYKYAKLKGERNEEIASAAICRVLEWVLS